MTNGTKLSELLGEHPLTDFTPIAYYDKHMDCLRIELRDCSMTEKRISPALTVLEDNYPGAGQGPYVGIMIKGVRVCFKEWDLPMDGVIYVTTILNKILKQLPEDPENVSPKEAITFVNQTANVIELKVRMDLAA